MRRLILERYELLFELGAAATASEAWIGRDTRSQTLVKVARVPVTLARDKETLRAYHSAARRLLHIDRPSLERVYEANVDGDSYYIITELVRGEPLDVMLERSPAGVSLEIALKIALDVCAALHVMHSLTTPQGKAPVIHYTLHPSRVMLTYLGEVKLVHAAISQGEHLAQTALQGALLGYRSPEECMGQEPDEVSNVFTVGVMLWELLTSQRLYGMADDFEVMQAICNAPPLPPSRFNPDVPPFLDALVNKALAKQPAQRIESISKLGVALRDVLKNLSPLDPQQLAQQLFSCFEDRIPAWQELFDAESQGDLKRLRHAVSSLYLAKLSSPEDSDAMGLDELRRTEEIVYPDGVLPLLDPPEAPTLARRLRGTSLSPLGLASQRGGEPQEPFEGLHGTMLGAPGKAALAQEQLSLSPHDAPTSRLSARNISFEQLSSDLEESAPRLFPPDSRSGNVLSASTREVEPLRQEQLARAARAPEAELGAPHSFSSSSSSDDFVHVVAAREVLDVQPEELAVENDPTIQYRPDRSRLPMEEEPEPVASAPLRAPVAAPLARSLPPVGFGPPRADVTEEVDLSAMRAAPPAAPPPRRGLSAGRLLGALVLLAVLVAIAALALFDGPRTRFEAFARQQLEARGLIEDPNALPETFVPPERPPKEPERPALEETREFEPLPHIAGDPEPPPSQDDLEAPPEMQPDLGASEDLGAPEHADGSEEGPAPE